LSSDSTSSVSIFQEWSEKDGGEKGFVEQFRSVTTFQISSYDDAPTSDSHVMPTDVSEVFGFSRTPRTIETSCMVAAGCGTTDYYDNFCGQLLGSTDRFAKLFAE
jgi:hypothetical protein